jgi:THO complex subunit 2
MFVDYVIQSLKKEEMCPDLPSMRELLVNYGLNINDAFYMHRYNMRLEQQAASSSQEELPEPGEDVEMSSPLQNIVADIEDLVDPKIWSVMSPQAYVSFWQFSLYDIQVPTNRYNQKISALTRDLEKLEKDVDVDRKKEKQILLQRELKEFKEEMDTQKAWVEKVIEKIKQEAKNWFLKGILFI